MAGNLWEIVHGPESRPKEVILRGGGFYSRAEFLVVSLRQPDDRNAAYQGVGIRVCADVF
jgi:formylglycine-generating enzyme required for sulfatase activity